MISIVIPGYNNIDAVRELLKSIYPQFTPEHGEVIVIDDGSDKCDMNDLKKVFTDLRIKRLENNKGAAFARNQGAKDAGYENVFFLDADMQLCEGVIAEVSKSMKTENAAAVVGTVSHIPLNRGMFQDYWALLKSYFHSLPGKYSSTFYPMVGAIKKSVFLEVGCFDPNIRGASVEDYEFSMRLAKKGYKVLFNPKILVKTGYKDFFTSIRQSFDRAKKWGVLFLDKRSFDNHTTTLGQGVSNIMGFSVWLFLIASLFKQVFIIPVLFCFLAILYLNRKFHAFILKKSGFKFLLISIVLYVVSSFFITLGFFNGILYITRSKEARRRAVYE